MRIAPALAAAAAAMLLAGCGVFGGNDGTAEPPAELVSFEPTLEVERVWNANVGRGSERLRLGLRPSTDGVRVYAGTFDGRVAALDAESGRAVWSVRTDLPLSAGPGYGNGVLALGTSDGRLLLLDAETGEERWRVSVGAEVLAAPAVGENVIALRTTDGRLRGLSLADGTELWTVTQSQPPLIVRGDTPPIISGNRVVAGFDNGRVGAYRIESGEPVWELPIGAPAGRTELDRLVDIAGDMQLIGSDVYAVGYQGRVVAADLNTGLVLWTQESSSLAGLGADQQRVFITTDVDHVVALSRANGTQRWSQEALRLRDVTAPTRFGDTVVVGDFEGYLHWLDVANGEFVARERAASSRIVSAPIIAGRHLVAQSEDGRVVAYTLVEEEDEDEEN